MNDIAVDSGANAVNFNYSIRLIVTRSDKARYQRIKVKMVSIRHVKKLRVEKN